MQQLLSDAGEYLRGHTIQRRLLIGVVVAATVLVIALVALPMVVAGYAEDWLRENGAGDARIDNVDINPFTGVARVNGLVAGEADGARLSVDLAEVNLRWWPLTSRRAFIQLLRLEGVHADVVARDDGVWQIGALTIAPAPAGTEAEEAAGDGPSWGFGSELVSLRDLHVSYADGVFDTVVDVRELRIGSQFSWEGGRSTALVVDLTVNGSPLVLKSDIAPWAEEPRLSGRLTLADLDLSDFAEELESLAGLQTSRGRIAMDLQITGQLDADSVLRLEITGPFNLDAAGFGVAGMDFAHDALRWDGTLALALPAQAQEPLLRLDGAFQLTGLSAVLPEQQLEAGLGDFRWNGELALSPPSDDGAPMDLTGQGGVLVRELSLSHSGLGTVLAELDQARFDALRITGPDALEAAGLAVQRLRLLADGGSGEEGAPELLSIGDLEARGLVAGAASVRMELLRIDEPVIVVVRDQAGGIERLSPALAAFDREPEPAPEPATLAETVADAEAVAEAAPAFAFELGRLEVSGTRWLKLLDRSVAPPVDFQLASLALTVDELSTRAPQPMRLELDTGAGNTRLAVTGTLGVLSGPPSADLEIKLANLELPPFSPYVPGYDVFRGRVSTDTTVALEDDELNVQNELVIERLKLTGRTDDGSDLLSQGMAMPVDVALDLLRDRDDRIKLSLPVTGSLSNPSFGTGDIFRQAMQKALQNAAMSYVKNALQPLGTLLLVGDLAAKAARPRFEPVTMAAGDAALTASGGEYLDKLSGLLDERPGLSLTLCGVAVSADQQALLEAALARQAAQLETAAAGGAAQPATSAAEVSGEPADAGSDQPPAPEISDAALLEVARMRTTAVVSGLVERGVDRDRLFACRETVDRDDGGEPRVEISL